MTGLGSPQRSLAHAGRVTAWSSPNSIVSAAACVSLLDFIEELRSRGVAFRSLGDAIDTTTAHGKFFLAIVGAFAELERSLIIERTNAGLAAARARGRKGGRRPKLTASQIAHARALLADPAHTIKDIAASLGVNRATIYRSLGLGNAPENPMKPVVAGGDEPFRPPTPHH